MHVAILFCLCHGCRKPLMIGETSVLVGFHDVSWKLHLSSLLS